MSKVIMIILLLVCALPQAGCLSTFYHAAKDGVIR